MRAAILTISTSRSAGEGDDESGTALAEFARSVGAEAVAAEIVTDDRGLIAERLRHHCDEAGC